VGRGPHLPGRKCLRYRSPPSDGHVTHHQPHQDARGIYNVEIVSLYHSFSFFGRSAKLLAALPYGVGNFTGEVFSQQRSIYRSGLVDLNVHSAVNFYGGRAMGVKDSVKWKQKILGASLRVVAPTGQYDPTKLVNWGISRSRFKPEFGYSQRWGNGILDGHASASFYTKNPAYYQIPVPKPQDEVPIGRRVRGLEQPSPSRIPSTSR
jgi:Putative MetA-pathway of phenol degradation